MYENIRHHFHREKVPCVDSNMFTCTPKIFNFLKEIRSSIIIITNIPPNNCHCYLKLIIILNLYMLRHTSAYDPKMTIAVDRISKSIYLFMLFGKT